MQSSSQSCSLKEPQMTALLFSMVPSQIIMMIKHGYPLDPVWAKLDNLKRRTSSTTTQSIVRLARKSTIGIIRFSTLLIIKTRNELYSVKSIHNHPRTYQILKCKKNVFQHRYLFELYFTIISILMNISIV